jgi:competence protein ComEA
MKKLNRIFAVMMFGVSLILAITGCSDRAVTLSDITENSTEEEAQPGTDSGSLDGMNAGETPSTITVYICGCVLNPGVYELPEGSRICDGLDAAGGFAEGADETRINLAGYLKDGDMVFFPEEGEEIPEGAVSEAQPISGTVAAGVTSGTSSSLININTASEDALCSLPGIGSSKAKAIIKYREDNGPFTDISQIMNVSGIGENLYNNIKDLICV